MSRNSVNPRPPPGQPRSALSRFKRTRCKACVDGWCNYHKQGTTDARHEYYERWRLGSLGHDNYSAENVIPGGVQRRLTDEARFERQTWMLDQM